ncbi:MAG: hypothetical protein ACI82A_000447 [Candidatus Azotimanducaceae bacterium]|jgi:hypothetical protein
MLDERLYAAILEEGYWLRSYLREPYSKGAMTQLKEPCLREAYLETSFLLVPSSCV